MEICFVQPHVPLPLASPSGFRENWQSRLYFRPEYIRNFMKRVRKKDSAVILASQNLEDFNIDGIREYTKPLFSIPTHVFLFNAGNIDSRFYIDTLQLEQSEYNLIRYPQRGVCLYKCGNERYNLMVHAPEYKEKLFGSAGGR